MTEAPVRTRIALVITELEVGGAEQCLTNLAVGLNRSRFDPLVIVLAPPPAPPRDALAVRLQDEHVPLHCLGFASKWNLASAVHQLRQRLRQDRPHIVQSMLFHANVVTRFATRRLREVAWCAGIRVADPSRFRQAIEARAIATAERVICVSDRVAGYAQQRLRVPLSKLAVMPNGVDVDRVRERTPANLLALGVPAKRKVITCVARLTAQKGIDQLLSAAPQMLNSLPEHDLLLVGDGSDAGSLQRMADRTAVAERIHFCGWQPNAGDIVRASDLLVLPSRWEGMPNVLLEAMACALPVVATDVEGVLELLGPLAPPQVVPAEQPQILAGQVVKILGDKAMARELGGANRQRVIENFSLKAMIHQYEALYQALSPGSNRP